MRFKYITIAAVSLLTGAFLHHQYTAAQEPTPGPQPAAGYQIQYERQSLNAQDNTAKESGVPAPQTDKLQTESNISAAELELLALVVEAEAGNQDLYGKQLVIDVILNRVDSPGFPNSITKVILQPRHFSTIWDGAAYRAEPTQETYEAIESELLHRRNSEILFFTSEGFSEYGTPWRKVGGHYFSTN